MGTVEPPHDKSYPLKAWAFWPQLVFAAILSVVFLSVIVSPESWSFGTAFTRSGRRLAPVLLVGGLFVIGQIVAIRLRGPVRIDSDGVFNPFARRKDRWVPWSEVVGIRNRRDGKSLELTKALGRRSVILLEMVREPKRLEKDLRARWDGRQTSSEPPDG